MTISVRNDLAYQSGTEIAPSSTPAKIPMQATNLVGQLELSPSPGGFFQTVVSSNSSDFASQGRRDFHIAETLAQHGLQEISTDKKSPTFMNALESFMKHPSAVTLIGVGEQGVKAYSKLASAQPSTSMVLMNEFKARTNEFTQQVLQSNNASGNAILGAQLVSNFEPQIVNDLLGVNMRFLEDKEVVAPFAKSEVQAKEGPVFVRRAKEGGFGYTFHATAPIAVSPGADLIASFAASAVNQVVARATKSIANLTQFEADAGKPKLLARRNSINGNEAKNSSEIRRHSSIETQPEAPYYKTQASSKMSDTHPVSSALDDANSVSSISSTDLTNSAGSVSKTKPGVTEASRLHRPTGTTGVGVGRKRSWLQNVVKASAQVAGRVSRSLDFLFMNVLRVVAAVTGRSTSKSK